MTRCTCRPRDQCENCFAAQVRELAERQGWLCYQAPTWRATASKEGFPDLVLLGNRVLFWELKREKGKLSPEQKEWIDRLDRTGASVAVMRPHHWPLIERTLRRGT